METEKQYWSDEQGTRRPVITGDSFIKLEKRVAILEKELLILKKQLETKPLVE